MLPILLLILLGLYIAGLRAEAYMTPEEKQAELLKRQPWATKPLAMGWTSFNFCVIYAFVLKPFLKHWHGWNPPAWLDFSVNMVSVATFLFLAVAYGGWHLRNLLVGGGARRHRLYHLFGGISALVPLVGVIYLYYNPPR